MGDPGKKAWWKNRKNICTLNIELFFVLYCGIVATMCDANVGVSKKCKISARCRYVVKKLL